MSKEPKEARLSHRGRARRRAEFCEAYMANGHKGSAAAMAVGYAEGRSARTAANKFVTELTASGELATVARQRAETAQLETVQTLREVARIAYADPVSRATGGSRRHHRQLRVAARRDVQGQVLVEDRGAGQGDASCWPVRARQQAVPAEPHPAGQLGRSPAEAGVNGAPPSLLSSPLPRFGGEDG